MGWIMGFIGILFAVVFMINLHFGLMCMGYGFRPQKIPPEIKQSGE